MSDPELARGCEVSLLIPHPTRIAVLVADDETSSGPHATLRLPRLLMSSEEPPLPEILAAVAVVDTARTPPLRHVLASPSSPSAGAGNPDDGEERAVALVLEFDSAAEASSGWTWRDLDAEVIGRLEPEAAREVVAAWAQERAEGWSPLRPQWSRPGWLAEASSWMVEQAAANGNQAIDPPRFQQLWGLSVVLVASSPDGNVFFKCSAEVFQHEALITQSLAARTPEDVPEVMAVDANRGWMLMRDFDAADLGDQDQSLWHEGLVAHARIQQSWLDRTDDLATLGLPIRSLTGLAAQVETMTDDASLWGRMPQNVRDQWQAAAPALSRSCLRLEEIGPGPTLVHGDLHPWNVAYGPTGTRVFDWTDAAVSHPFIDLATYVFRTRDLSVRRRLVDAYVAAWSKLGSEKSLQEAAALGLVVGALYQVQTYRALLPTLMSNGAEDGLAGGDISWVKRSLNIQESGLESLT